MAASTLPSNPTGTELASRQLSQSANTNPVESNMRRDDKQEQQQKQKPYEGKSKESTIDTSDLLIECRLLFTKEAGR
jgi:hypothetical protein